MQKSWRRHVFRGEEGVGAARQRLSGDGDDQKAAYCPMPFDGDARIVFEEVANTNLHANVDEMWGLLEEASVQ